MCLKVVARKNRAQVESREIVNNACIILADGRRISSQALDVVLYSYATIKHASDLCQ